MAEEHQLEEGQGHRLCANNCGFFGSSATLDLCSKCYREHRLKEEQSASAISAIQKSLSPPNLSPPQSESAPIALKTPKSESPESSKAAVPEATPPLPVPSNRCGTCKRKTGLTGFQCKCGLTFCGTHRYPEQHTCQFDYKAAGREKLSQANPVIKGEKLNKI